MSSAHELREIGAGIYAYLQRGGWGFSNAGLVRGRDASLLVDTLYDLTLTRRMLAEMQRVTGAAGIESVVNTHANGDHCWGNQAVDGARIVSSKAAAEEMLELSPRLMDGLVRVSRAISGSTTLQRALGLLARLGVKPAGDLVDASDFVADAFGPFEFGAVRLRIPDTTFEGRLELDVGDKAVHVIEVGPAHTRGDAIVHVPEDGVVYTGDILFIDSHPISWAGPVANWIAACDRILALDVEIVVPGHGPITDKQGVRQVRDYWSNLSQRASEAWDSGASAEDLARDLVSVYDWSEAERLVVNVNALYRELAGERRTPAPISLLASMGRLARRVREQRPGPSRVQGPGSAQ